MLTKKKVLPIKNYIVAQTGLPCWIDLDGIESDAQFESVICGAIDNCEVLLFMYSHQHTLITNIEEDWTYCELNYANSHHKRVVFINVDGTPLYSVFDLKYGTKQQVDARSNEAMDRLCYDLLNWLEPKEE